MDIGGRRYVGGGVILYAELVDELALGELLISVDVVVMGLDGIIRGVVE